MKASPTAAPASPPVLANAYLTPKQAAARLGICVATLYSKVLPHLAVSRVGSRTLIAEHRLAEFLASTETPGARQ